MMKYPGSMEIKHLKELSTRARNLLRENDIDTVQKFIDYFSKYGENGVPYFNHKRNAGKKTIDEVQAFVKNFLNDKYEDAQEIDEIKSNIEKLKIAIAKMETKLAELENKRNTTIKQQENIR